MPITEQGETLAVLDVSDEKHPRLVHPGTLGELNKIEHEGKGETENSGSEHSFQKTYILIL